ncbi:glycine cleavage T C-terminal barrel domain-containing protein [Algirhabdus cladophorae]|uniref:glycine cleavage T C-terminal barrel domain-containing protein n=1 Tax=Algirhabdus cladophorae TaxID=3377108 RepID=UPI003B84817F
MTFSIGVGPNLRKSAYFDATVRDGVRSFSVYNHMLIPGHFGDPEAEYDRLMSGVAMWDVAAQRQVQIQGPDAARLVQYLTPRNLDTTRIGQGRYVPLCDQNGWIINDPVLLKLAEDRFWLSVADSDIHLWAAAIGHEKGWDAQVSEPDVSPLAIQGPKATDLAARLFGDDVRAFKYFAFEQTQLRGIPLVLARSGWSKQGGFELYLMDHTKGVALWDIVKEAGAEFGIGPGAPNDIERLESGLISYGADMRLQTHRATPFEMGFGPLVHFDHDFVGRTALEQLDPSAPKRLRIGVTLEDNPTSPGHQVTAQDNGRNIGFIAEFAYSKRLSKTIGIGLIDSAYASPGTSIDLILPEGKITAHVCDIPFL